MSLERLLFHSRAVPLPVRVEAKLRPLSLRLNFAWTLAGHAVYAGAQWGMLILLAKLGSREMLGRFALGLAVAAPVVMLTNRQLRLVQATDARHEFSFRDYLSLRLLASGAAFLFIAGAAADYGTQAGVLVWVMVGASLGYIARFLIVGTSAARSFRAQAPLYALALLVAGLGSWRLVPHWGLVGAAWALSASLATLMVGAALILWCARRGRPSPEPDASRLGAADAA